MAPESLGTVDRQHFRQAHLRATGFSEAGAFAVPEDVGSVRSDRVVSGAAVHDDGKGSGADTANLSTSPSNCI